MLTYFTGVTLIDATGADAVPNATVEVAGDRIRAAYPGAPSSVEGGARVVDGRGLTLMPGLIDCHDHLAHPGLDMAKRARTPVTLMVHETARTLRQTLEAGITTVRDAALLDLGTKLALERGVIVGPRVVISLAIICQTGGHWDYTLPSGIVEDYPMMPGIPDPIADGVEAVRKKVREVIRAGADWVKFATTGGIGSPTGGPDIRQFTYEETAALIDEAHSAGKPTFVHAHGGPGLKNAIRAGVTSVEHAVLGDPEDFEEMYRRGTWLVPTFTVLEMVLERIHQSPGSMPAEKVRKVQQVAEAGARSFQCAIKSGVKMAMGTDAGGLQHGQNARELEYLVRYGMTPMQAIVTSTRNGADLLGFGDWLGTITPGKKADLILVEGNPLADIRLLQDPSKIRLVMKDGTVYKDSLQTRPTEV